MLGPMRLHTEIASRADIACQCRQPGSGVNQGNGCFTSPGNTGNFSLTEHDSDLKQS